MSPISFMALDAYARRYGIAEQEFDIFVHLVMAMDDEYLQWHAEELKKKAPRNPDARPNLQPPSHR